MASTPVSYLEGTGFTDRLPSARSMNEVNEAKRAIVGLFDAPVPRDAKEGFRSGLRAVSEGMKIVSSTVVAAPIQGAKENGVKGFAKGLVAGVASLALPVTALGVGAVQVARGTMNQIEARRSGKVWNEKQRQWVEVAIEVDDESELPPIELLDECPSLFICPITQDMMRDPVVASDGFTYERSAIEGWLKKHTTSPLTGAQLPSKAVVPNNVVRTACKEWLEERMRQQQAAESTSPENEREVGGKKQLESGIDLTLLKLDDHALGSDRTACTANRTCSSASSGKDIPASYIQTSDVSMSSSRTLSRCSTGLEALSDFDMVHHAPNIHSPSSSLDSCSTQDLLALGQLEREGGQLGRAERERGQLDQPREDVYNNAQSARPTVSCTSDDLLGTGTSDCLSPSRSQASSTSPVGDLLIWDDVSAGVQNEKQSPSSGKAVQAAPASVVDSLI